MAHRLEHRAVRGARHAARRRVRALPRAFVALALIAGAPAACADGVGADALARSGAPDAVAFWGEPGRPTWTPDAWLATAFPHAFAGLVLGGWAFEAPGRAPESMPWPGVVTARVPLVAFDSLAIGSGGGGWLGHGAPLVLARGLTRPMTRRARAVFGLTSGTPDLDETVIAVGTGDSTRGFEATNRSATRGDAGALEGAGLHQWGVGGHLTRGRHRLDASFAQRGIGSKLDGLEEQWAAGESGHAAWAWEGATRRASVRASRGHDAHQSFGGALASSRRDAQETAVEATAGVVRAEAGAETRFAWSHSRIDRTRAGAFGAEVASWWGGARGWTPLAGGMLAGTLGAGRHTALTDMDVAGSLAWERAGGPWQMRLGVERTLAPAWADLAPGTAPFMQRTWSAEARAAWRDGGPVAAGAWVIGGRTIDRALVTRLPLEEQWLRAGLRRDPEPYDFVIAGGDLAWRSGPWGATAEGHVLARNDRSLQARVDPSAGARLGGERRFSAFDGDLGVVLRGIVEAVGTRESEPAPSRVLPGYVSLGAGVELSLADAVVVLRFRNLEDRRREQTWQDAATGTLARGPGREFRLALVWHLFN